MKPSEERFKFPIKLYDPIMYKKTQTQEEVTGEYIEKDWVMGWAHIYIDDIISYRDTFSKGRPVQDVIDNGFDMTHIVTRDDEFYCMWPKSKFEAKMDDHIERLMNEGIESKYIPSPQKDV